MLQILTITAPIYLIIAAGWLSVRSGLFERRDTRVLGRFVANFCVPALLFRALSSRPLAEIVHGAALGAYALGSLAMLLGATTALKRWRGEPLPRAALLALGMSSSNSAYIGFPVASQLLGPVAAVGLALAMVVENLLIIPLALVLAERQGPVSRSFISYGRTLAGVLRNPMIVAMVLGFAVAASGLPVPDVIARTVQIVAAAASPVALFVIGGTLVGLQIAGLRRTVTMVAVGKLVLHPAAVLLALWWLPPVEPPLRAAAIVFAAVPMLSIYPVLAQKAELEGPAAAALLVTTVASFASLSLWLWLLPNVLGWPL